MAAQLWAVRHSESRLQDIVVYAITTLDNHEIHREHGTVNRKPERLMPEQFDRVTDPILIADNDRKYVDLNQAAAKALGRPKEAIVGRLIDDFFSEADQQPIPAAWQKFIGAADQFGTCKLRGADGKIFMYRSRANVIPGLHVPTVPVVLMSSYADSESVKHGNTGFCFIQKPFVPAAIVKAARIALALRAGQTFHAPSHS